MKVKWFAATIVNLNEDGTVRVRFTSHRSFCEGSIVETYAKSQRKRHKLAPICWLKLMAKWLSPQQQRLG